MPNRRYNRYETGHQCPAVIANGTTKPSVGNWDLKNDKSFQNMIASIEDFQIVIQQRKWMKSMR